MAREWDIFGLTKVPIITGDSNADAGKFIDELDRAVDKRDALLDRALTWMMIKLQEGEPEDKQIITDIYNLSKGG